MPTHFSARQARGPKGLERLGIISLPVIVHPQFVISQPEVGPFFQNPQKILFGIIPSVQTIKDLPLVRKRLRIGRVERERSSHLMQGIRPSPVPSNTDAIAT